MKKIFDKYSFILLSLIVVAIQIWANRTITISDYVLFGCSIVMLILVNITYLKAYHEVEKRQAA